MSLLSTRSGRMVKRKQKVDAEYINGSSVKAVKSLTPSNIDRAKAARRNPTQAKYPKEQVSFAKQQIVIGVGCGINLSGLPSPTEENTLIADGVGEGATAKVQTVHTDDVAVNIKKSSAEMKSAINNKNKDMETPASAVRRSGRAPVPSSKYKDMELDLARGKKRLISAVDAYESEPERTKKNRKMSNKPTEESENVANKSTHSHTNVPLEIHESAEVMDDSKATVCVEDEQHSHLEESLHKEAVSFKDNSAHLLEVHVVDSSEQSVVQERPSSSLHTTELSSEPNMKAVYPSIKIGGQQLTFTEQDGETLAVVTISSDSPKDEVVHELLSVESLTQEPGISLEVVDSEQGKKPFSELVTVNPTIHSSGEIVKRDFVEAPFATVIGHDGATYLNLSVEATKISTILKGKHLATVAKSNNPLKGHGRVLRNPAGSMIVRTTLVPPRVTQQESQDSKPAVTYSLLGPKKLQSGDSAYSATNTVALPVPAKSSHMSQSPQTIVIRQKLPQKTTALSNVPQVVTSVSNENMLTLVEVAHDMSVQGVTSSVYATDDCEKDTPAMPKTASEILLHRLKVQPNLLNISESNQAQENSSQKSSCSIHTNDTEAVENVNELQTSQQDTPETELHLDISQMSQDGNGEVIIESHELLVANMLDTMTAEMNTSELSASATGAQNNKLCVDLNGGMAVSETSQVQSEDCIAADSLVQIPAARSLGSMAISEESIVVSASNSLSEIPSSSVLTVVKNVDSHEIKSSTSTERLSLTETIDAGQAALTDRTHLGNAVAAEPVGTGKKFIEKITVVDNGVEYDVRIVSEEEVTEEIIDSAATQILQIKQSGGSVVEHEPEVKQEVDDSVEDSKPEIEKQSSSTQTVYSPKVQNTSVAGTTATTTHTLTTVVDEGPEKKHVYYVSVVPNKGIMAKSKTSMYSSAASWVIGDNGMYCCEKCDYQTDRKANFYKHRKSHTGSKPHMCSVCQYKAGTSSNLKRHMGIHKDIREHKCDVCGLCFRQKIHLERHVKYKHEEKSIKCPLCDYICANEQPDLKMHIKRKHSNENSGEMVTCPECNIQVGNKKDLKQHLKFHRDGPELKLFCKECSFVTDCQSRLKRHTAIHSKMKPFQCGVCNYRAAQKEHVLRHLRTQHKIDIKREGKRPWRRHKKDAVDDGSKERSDFTSGDKIFACNHCTMRFAKLINLYKHLHTQHGDIMPAETGGNFYCVVCEFSTTNKKNLLVHMRRHNMTDQTPPTHVYSCVLCRYVNPRRRNLFQHMRKKHNINISRQGDGADGEDDGDGQDMEGGADVIEAVNQAITPNSGTVSIATAEVTENTPGMAGDVASVIKIEDLTRMAAGSGDNDDMQTLVIDSRGADMAEVVHTSSHTAEALEGLQALAEQAGLIDNIIEEQVPALDEQQTIVIEQNSGTTEVIGTVETVGQLQHMVHSPSETLTSPTGDGTERLELSEDQLSSLRSGDVVEMEDQLYLVELTQDPSNPHKQVLSFLPVTTATV